MMFINYITGLDTWALSECLPAIVIFMYYIPGHYTITHTLYSSVCIKNGHYLYDFRIFIFFSVGMRKLGNKHLCFVFKQKAHPDSLFLLILSKCLLVLN